VLTIRPIRPDDEDRLGRMFWRLSPDTVYRRFFSPVKAPRASVLRHLASVDHDLREALVAEADGEIIGVARYDRSPGDRTRAEVAVVVEDAWQRRGVASTLLRGLGETAKGHGVEAFTGTMLGDNVPAARLARSLSHRTELHWGDGGMEMTAPLSA
jgi:GNAT superfamily N-acetyltransferase